MPLQSHFSQVYTSGVLVHRNRIQRLHHPLQFNYVSCPWDWLAVKPCKPILASILVVMRPAAQAHASAYPLRQVGQVYICTDVQSACASLPLCPWVPLIRFVREIGLSLLSAASSWGPWWREASFYLCFYCKHSRRCPVAPEGHPRYTWGERRRQRNIY